MKTVRKFIIPACVLISIVGDAQNKDKPERTYEDYCSITRLTLRDDGTFELTTTDPVFTSTFNNYTSTGDWMANGEEVTLNPGLTPRNAEIALKEGKLEGEDSITIRINYSVEEFEKEQFISNHSVALDLMTVGVNKKSNYHHLVRNQVVRTCLFAPKVKHQVRIDSTNTFKIRRTKLERVWFYTYGMPALVELRVKDPDSNYLVIEVNQPVDRERMPRNRKVIVRNKKAFYYEQEGKVITSSTATPLILK